MPERYSVRLEKEYLVFSAAHFITFNGDICERLHGHNYRVAAEVAGPLDENHYVVDFIFLRDTLKHLIDALDHHMLLPTGHPLINVVPSDDSVEVTFRDRRWVFPRGDCVLLPVPNTTAELIAHYLAEQLRDALAARSGMQPERVQVGVDECFGQWGVCELR
ncbi:MAG: 6-pyruvoyl tetrahydropterin synthase family protein, partial [Planctomycetia bacterium]|nr:6-pyruvoyl tetrahydropterin synthase family protein [Planctomycetia bacterium]